MTAIMNPTELSSPQNTPNRPEYDDEIDLFELFQNLWDQKWLILVLSLLFPVLAFVYVTYIDRKPDLHKASVLMEIASIQIQTAAENRTISFLDRSDDLIQIIERTAGVSATKPRGTNGLLILEKTHRDKAQATASIEKAIELIQARHQNMLANLSNVQLITPTAQMGQTRVNHISGLEKRNLIVAVALVLGGMLGVFIALIRSAVRKRRQTLQQTA
jgi:LPS O-antigen subunit length determinant protein (WzzB/FepE family)